MNELEFKPAEGNRDDASAILGDFKKGRFSKIKVLERWIAPATVVVGLGKVRRAEISSGDSDSARKAPFRVIIAFHFVA